MPRFTFFYIIALVVVATSKCEETYDIKYDNVDIDEILKSERLLTNYIKCLMDEGPCTEDGRDLKDTLPDAITTDCSKCTEKQKDGSNRIMHFIIENRPEDWDRLEMKYDKGGKYRLGYLEEKAAGDHDHDDNSNN